MNKYAINPLTSMVLKRTEIFIYSNYSPAISNFTEL